MGQFFEEIPSSQISWIKQQKVFWVATAPLAEDGHVNVSPKGYDQTFHIVDSQRVWYEDLSGSGTETIAHLRENRRITILFVAFEGPPKLVRLFGKGTVHEFGTPEYEEFVPIEKRLAGSRAVIVVDVHKVGTSCGFSIPFFDYRCERMKHVTMGATFELKDIAHEASCSNIPEGQPKPKGQGLKHYWELNNLKSIDGLPALESAHNSEVGFIREEWEGNREKDDESIGRNRKVEKKEEIAKAVVKGEDGRDDRMVIGFILGLLASAVVIGLRRALEARGMVVP
ncbi:hypothetical protein BDQ17DRAFT_1354206 [Cyathus striatus]|nr:hypothetical protein BDQ17DRAFT_1354206 [Cyathus striatus]